MECFANQSIHLHGQPTHWCYAGFHQSVSVQIRKLSENASLTIIRRHFLNYHQTCGGKKSYFLIHVVWFCELCEKWFKVNEWKNVLMTSISYLYKALASRVNAFLLLMSATTNVFKIDHFPWYKRMYFSWNSCMHRLKCSTTRNFLLILEITRYDWLHVPMYRCIVVMLCHTLLFTQ